MEKGKVMVSFLCVHGAMGKWNIVNFVACGYTSVLFNLYVDDSLDESSQASKADTKLSTAAPGKQNKSKTSKNKPNGMLWPCI